MSSTRSVPAPPSAPNTREHCAIRLFEERHHEIVLVGPDTFEVPSCTGTGVYTVEYGANESCSCPDAEFHPETACKHLLAVAICLAKRRRVSEPVRYSERVEAARMDAAAKYRAEIRKLAALDMLGD